LDLKMGVEDVFASAAAAVALLLEGMLVITTAIGALTAVVKIVISVGRPDFLERRRKAWIDFASWLLLALEFALAADIVRTAIAPSWNELGQLGVIAVIRTFLGFFLERDVSGMREAKSTGEKIEGE
jgi:uncharacterized membrane protein